MEKTDAIVRDPDIFEKKILRLFVPNALSSSGVVFINLLGPITACSRNMQYECFLEMNYLQLSPCREETS